MGTTYLFSYLLLSLFAYQALCQGTTTAPCCNTKTVKDAPAGQEDLNGEYVLNPSSATERHENCADGCIYTRNDEEYCFMNVAADKAAGSITCDATTGGPAAGASTPDAGAGGSTPGAGESTPQGGAGATTASAGGTTASVAERGQAAQESKTAATTEKAAAETTKAAADESTTQAALVASKIDEVVASATGRRMKRQETPTSCTAFQTMVTDMNTAINQTDAGYAEATKLGKLLAAVDATTVGCTSDDVAALNTAKSAVEAAKAVAEADSNAQESLIQKAIEKINAAIAIINEVNALLLAAGQSTLADPGTTLATVTVPSLATDVASGEATTAAGGAGETTPGAGAGAGATTLAGGAGATTPGAGAGESTPAGGAGETTPAAGAGETTPGSMVSMDSTPHPGRKLFGKRSRGSIF